MTNPANSEPDGKERPLEEQDDPKESTDDES